MGIVGSRAAVGAGRLEAGVWSSSQLLALPCALLQGSPSCDICCSVIPLANPLPHVVQGIERQVCELHTDLLGSGGQGRLIGAGQVLAYRF